MFVLAVLAFDCRVPGSRQPLFHALRKVFADLTTEHAPPRVYVSFSVAFWPTLSLYLPPTQDARTFCVPRRITPKHV